MAPRTLRFVWGTPPVPAGRWHGGLVNLKIIPSTRRTSAPVVVDPWHDYRRHRLHLSLRGLLAWTLGLALVAYLAGAALVHRRLERASVYNRVTYLDLTLPSRWPGLDRLRGQANIAEGRALLAVGRFNEGVGFLRAGLARHPGDHEARLALAQIYAALRLGPQAEKLLRDGLDHGYPGRAFLEFVFALAADADHPARWAELCQLARVRFDALPAEARSAPESLWLDQQRVRALLAADRRADALALVESRYAETHPFRREIALLHLLETNQAPEAVALAKRWSAEFPRAPEPLRLLVRAHRQAGDHAAMDMTLERLRALDPTRPEALLYALAQHHRAARPDAVRQTLDTLFFRHGADPALYPALASVLVELRDHPGLDRVTAELRERGLSPLPSLWARLQLAANTRDWPAALAAASAFEEARGLAALDEARTGWLETIVRLARACLEAGSGTQASLVELVADRPVPLRLYVGVLEALLEAGRADTARQILGLATGPYPASVTLAAFRPRIENALAAAAPPPAANAAPAISALESAETLAAAFTACIDAKDTTGALALLAHARRARPAWWPAAESRLDALELPVRARGDDPLRLQLLARSTLAREATAPGKLLALAREIETENPVHRAHALLLVKEILRHNPAHTDALRQLVAWNPGLARPGVDAAP